MKLSELTDAQRQLIRARLLEGAEDFARIYRHKGHLAVVPAVRHDLIGTLAGILKSDEGVPEFVDELLKGLDL